MPYNEPIHLLPTQLPCLVFDMLASARFVPYVATSCQLVESQASLRPRGVSTVGGVAIGIWLAANCGLVLGDHTKRPISFELDVQPVLTAYGCNAGACHGKARGQNGFQLSLLAFDPDFDFDALTINARGRRVFHGSPSESLILLKATAEVPHGGGRRFSPESDAYETLHDWIASGTPRRSRNEPHLSRITVQPDHMVMMPGERQTINITAHYSDGSARNVTDMTACQSNEEVIASVDKKGIITAGQLAGETVAIARYMNLLATCRITIPLDGQVPDEYYDELPVSNFVDKLVWQKLQSLGIAASEPTDDMRYLRRVHLDLIGRLPTPDEVRTYSNNRDPEKRGKLIDRLLERPEYADHWANKWMDLLRPNPYRVGIKAVLNYDNWIRQSFRGNKPYDQMVRELLTAQGSTWHNGAVTLFRDRRSPDEIAPLVSQLFLGIRLECAKCHHHPFEKWGQDDFYSFAAFFARLGRKGTGLSPPISGGEEIVLVNDTGTVKHPLTARTMEAKPLYGEKPPNETDVDPRQVLADWVTSDHNEFFARVMVNRVWADLMGRGLVEPVDDLRATNPPSNEPLFKALACDFRDSGYDLKQLLRTITTSHVYALSSSPNDRNIVDTRNYSRHYRRRMRAETLLDAMTDITGIGEDFDAMPPGSRATQIWTHRVSSLFLDTFGRPDPNKDPPCERTSETTVTQALHLMNAPSLHAKVTSDSGQIAQLASSDMTSDQIVEEIYLLAYSRFPEPSERAIALSLFDSEESDGRRTAAEDLMWALINTPEFVFID